MAKDSGREKALDATMSQLRKRFGDGAIMKMGEAVELTIEAIPTGSIALDLALGIGGVPRGRIVEIYGPESSGKTTLCQHIIAEAQKMGGTCAFVDVEHALDPVYARKIGVNVDDLYISQPDTGEQALEIAEALIRSGAIDVVVIDSVAALVPRAEIEGEMGDSHVGLQARLMSQALRKLAGAVKKSNTCLIFTNQIRMKIGVLFGNPETTTGGQALKFYSSVRLEIRSGQPIRTGGDDLGKRTKVKVKKNKVAPPFKAVEFDIMFNEGISVVGDVLDVATEMELIEKRGAYFSYGDTRLGQGRENAKQFLQDNPSLMLEIENRVREQAGLPRKEAALSMGSAAAAPAAPAASARANKKAGKPGKQTALSIEADSAPELELEELEIEELGFLE